MGPRGGGPPSHQPPPQAFVHHVPFDFVMCEKSFPRIRPELDEEDVIKAMKERDLAIRPEESDYKALRTLHDQMIAGIQKVQAEDGSSDFMTSVDQMDNPENFKILEFHTVGSFTRNCLLRSKLRVDIALIIDTLPTHETVGQVSRKILQKMKEDGAASENLLLDSADYGFDVMDGDKTIAVWLTIPFERLQELCPGTHISPELCQLAQRAIKHTQWYSTTVQNPEQDVADAPFITRIFRDMRTRYEGFSRLNVWVADLLVAHCIMNNANTEDGGKLNPAKVMRRLLQLLASGIFLPHSVGLSDPTEQGYRVHQDWSPNDMDSVCYTAQTLLRVWSHGGHKAVLGIDPKPNLVGEMSMWNDIVVTPSENVIRVN